MEIYKGIATGHCQHEDLIDFLNYVFGMNGMDQGFYRLLPKLYRPQYSPEDYNFVVTEDGKLRAAVGAYSIEMQVMGHALSAMGVGNVAVHPFHRGKGYMKDGMRMALDDMLEKGVDFAVLGGRRQRYSYFGFEPAGLCGKFEVNRDNLRHALSGVGDGYRARIIDPEDVQALDAIAQMTARQPSFAVRPREKLYDVLNNWESKVCIVEGPDGSIAGYFLATDAVSEIDCAVPEHAVGVLKACHALMGQDNLTLRVPVYARAMFELLTDVAERCELVPTENYNVFHYEKVVRACLELKAAQGPLPDGAVELDIDGFAGREVLRIEVRGGVPSVQPGAGTDALRLTHRQAMNLLFGLFAPQRCSLPACAAAWFPLPLFVPEVDND